jgi:hypothetical protein
MHAPPLVRRHFVTGAENAQVREPTRVLVQTGGSAVDVIGPETVARVPRRVLGAQGVNLRNYKATCQ